MLICQGYWLKNPFWKSEFEIKSDKEIKKIINAEIKSVNVNTEKSKTNTNNIISSDRDSINNKGKRNTILEKNYDIVNTGPISTENN